MSGSLRSLYCVLGKRVGNVGFRCVCFPNININLHRRDYVKKILKCENDGQTCVQLKRSKSTLKPTTDVSFTAPATAASDSDRDQFLAAFPDIVRDLTDAGFGSEIIEVKKRFSKVLHYNVPGGKMARGLAVVQSYRILAKENLHNAENLFLAQIMGWCVEMVRGSLLADKIYA